MCVCHLCILTWVALGHGVDVGGAEHADPCPPAVLHAHAHAQEESRYRPHQKHHAEHDAGDGRAPAARTHTHTLNCSNADSRRAGVKGQIL